jgi:hypothetical protein
VFLVRDPRGWLASAEATARRRNGSAPRRPTGDPTVALARRGKRLLDLHAAWRERGADALVVRHEDLLAAPAATLGGLLLGLDLDARPATLAAILDEVAPAAFEPSAAGDGGPAALPPALRDAADEVFAEIFDTFYSAEEPAPARGVDEDGIAELALAFLRGGEG